MVKKLVMIAFGLTVSCAAAQSLKSQDPAPPQSVVDSGIVDNFVGHTIGTSSEVRVTYTSWCDSSPWDFSATQFGPP